MSSLSKNTIREIIRSPGRFLAILAIIVLGSGFFVGLRVSQKAMTATADTYLEKTNFFDFSAASTLGYTEDDVEAFLADPEVLDAEGGFQIDALVNLGGETDMVYAFYSLPERINLPDLLEGRLPETPGECLADSWSGLHPGARVTVSGDNDQDTLDLFTVRELTVVGVCTSPLYLNFERGSTSLGSGSVTSFCYVLPEVFDADYFTTVYLRCPDMPGAYTDAYDSRSEDLEPGLTDLAEARAEVRYNDVVADARQELDDGWAEYYDGLEEYEIERADAEQELSDAWQELLDAQKELEDGAREIDDARQEIDDGWAELRDSADILTDARAELNDARQELEDAQQEIADGWIEYNDGLAEFETQKADGEAELQEARTQLEEALSTLREGETEYADNLALYEDGEAQYWEGYDQLEDSRKTLEDGETAYEKGLADYRSGSAQYSAGAAQLAEGKAQLDAAKEKLDSNQAAFDGLINQLLNIAPLFDSNFPCHTADELFTALESEDEGVIGTVNYLLGIAPGFVTPEQAEMLPENSAGILDARDALAQGWAEYNAGVAAYEQNAAYLSAAGAQLSAGYAQLQEARKELDEGWEELREGETTLRDSRAELDQAKEQLEAGRRELDEGWTEYNEGLADYEEGLAEFETSVAEAEAELQEAYDTLIDAEAQYAEGLVEYEDGLAEYQDGVRRYNEGRADLEQAEIDLREAQQEYDDGLAEYEDGLREYNDAKAEADQEFADAEAELADALQELEDGEQELKDLEHPDTYLLGRWSNVGYACFESDSSIVKSISSVFPVFFFLVAALICITTVSRMVEEQRSQLGVLMALGYGRLAIMSKFLIYSGSATLIGGIAGILLGSWMIPLVVWQAYHIMYSFSDKIEFFFDLPLSAVTFALYMAAMLAVTYLSCRREIRDTPANVIRPKAPKAGKRVLLERVPIIWNRLSFLWKVTVRNIFRYKLRVCMMILGVAGCTALMLTGFGINDSIQNVVDYQFTEVSLYDFTVTFTGDMDPDQRQAFLEGAADVAEDALFIHQSSVTASANRVEKEVYLNAVDEAGIDRMGEFMDFHSGLRALPFPGEGEALVNTGLAEALSLKPGDTLEIRDGDRGRMTVTVSGVYDNYIYNNIYVSSDTYAAQLGEPEMNYALVLKDDGVETGEALAAILGLDDILTASASQDLRDRIGSMMESLIYIVLLTIVCAAALAFVVIYNLTNINIQERLREIATVKVLGFYDVESALYVLRENLLLTLLGAAAGVPLGIALNSFVMGQIDIDLIHFTAKILPLSYLWSIALTILFGLTVDFLMYFRLNRIDPAAALKAAE